MSVSWKVTVLCPTGHRVTVKATRDCPILKVLREACLKRGLDPEHHRLCHHKTLLDNGLTIRFANLPNNATVDLVEVYDNSTVKATSNVKVAVDVQAKGRSIFPNVSVQTDLYSVLEMAEAIGKGEEGEEPVVVYMRKEIVGEDDLKKTTLIMLGITTGSVALRSFYKKPDVLKDQAKVLNERQSQPTKKVEREWRPMKKDPDITLSKIVPEIELKSQMEAQESEPKKIEEPEARPIVESKKKVEELQEKTGKVTTSQSEIDDEEMEISVKDSRPTPKTEQLSYVGSGNAVIFEIGDGGSRKLMERLSDDFFELNIDDVKMIHKDNQKKVKELHEEEQLLTKSMRKAQEDGRKLQMMNRYKKCLIRVTFRQDNLVVQGIFSPGQTIRDVKEFLKEYLMDPDLKFYLFTTPPRKILDAGSTLLDNDCVPAAILHFHPEEKKAKASYLKPDIWNILSNSLGVERSVKESGLMRKAHAEQNVGISSTESFSSSSNSLGTISEEGQGQKRPMEPPKRDPDNSKMPKWFRTGKQ